MGSTLLLALTLMVAGHQASPHAGVRHGAFTSMPAQRAADFINMQGINAYSCAGAPDDKATIAYLPFLRIKHVRVNPGWGGPADSFCDTAPAVNELAPFGINADILTYLGFNAGQAATYMRELTLAPDSIEGPNEPNPSSASTINLYLASLRAAFPTTYIIGSAIDPIHPITDEQPFLFGKYATPDTHDYLYYLNPETPGWNPSLTDACGNIGSDAWYVCLAKITTRDNPSAQISSTENGYGTDAKDCSEGNFNQPRIQNVYLQRQMLNHFQMGFYRSYIYKAVDGFVYPGYCSDGYDSNGLIYRYLKPSHHTDHFAPKPSFVGLSFLNEILYDSDNAASTSPLTVSITGQQPTTNVVLLQKRDGSYWLVFWDSVSLYSRSGNNDVLYPDVFYPVTVTVQAATNFTAYWQPSPTTGQWASKRLGVGTSHSITVSGSPSIMEVGYPLPPSLPSNIPPAGVPWPR